MSSGIMETAIQSQMEAPEEFYFAEMPITKLCYNWRQVAQGFDDMGEDYEIAEIGEEDTFFHLKVKEIVGYEGAQQPFYVIKYEDGSEATIYNPNIAFRKNVSK